MKTSYKISPSVFYRCYDKKVVLYDTSVQKVYTFNEITEDILCCFEEWNTAEAVVNKLWGMYAYDDFEEFTKSIIEFIELLSQKDIIKSKHSQKGKEATLETKIASYVSKTRQLSSVLFELTYKCNEKCRHCYISKSNKQELTTAQILSVLDELSEMNVLNIVFTGGELFVRKDIWTILDYAYAKHFVIDIFTNGNLLRSDDILHLKQIWPRSVQFSVYSHIPEKHDSVTQIQGSFDKTIAAIKSCKLIGIPVNIKMPVFKETIDDIQGMIDMANEIEVSIEIGENITPKKTVTFHLC